MEPMYYLITGLCIAGSAYTSFNAGRKDGICRMLNFLDAHKNRFTNEVTIRLKDDDLEIL